ncbi:hypothetical protein BLNAU_12677 [Blattamonas nauphoetae]|uniref:Uncharacterized protein n=1 Tax=Blattamonas nauphoetae TaxID=2049346 RepID=A0ABQ9XLR8_9EUKA|nr:hypothetical protein BLNAU_12677 [Blattamonas nauphoetae]
MSDDPTAVSKVPTTQNFRLKKRPSNSATTKRINITHNSTSETQEDDLANLAQILKTARRNDHVEMGISLEDLNKDDVVEEEVKIDTTAMDQQFSAEAGYLDADYRRQQFIEAKLKEKEKPEETQKEVDDKTKSLMTNDDLYILPPELKPKQKPVDNTAGTWQTGIAEVELPIEYKVHNMRQTESALQQLHSQPRQNRARSSYAKGAMSGLVLPIDDIDEINRQMSQTVMKTLSKEHAHVCDGEKRMKI